MDSQGRSGGQGRNRPPMYRFRGADDRPPPGGTDSYRPSDFNFRAEKENRGRPPPNFSQQPQPPPPRAPTGNRPGRTNQPARRGRAGDNINFRQKNRPWQQRPGISDRPLLRGQRAPTPEQLLGMNEGEARFKALEELSNSEEEDMELDSDTERQPFESNEASDEPPRKRLHLSMPSDSVSPNVQPQWSNPDPYTSLPPPDETHGKRKDVVKLIRKAKASAGGHKLSASAAEDFISFSMDDEHSEDDMESSTVAKDLRVTVNGIPGASTGPKFSHVNNLDPDRLAPGVSTASVSIDSLGPPPPLAIELKDTLDGDKIDTWPPPKPQQTDGARVGSKRSHSEVSDVPKTGSKRGKIQTQGSIIPEWAPKENQDPIPWLRIDHSGCESMGVRLHKEICDFYDFIKPRHFENEIRHALVKGISRFVRDRYRDAEVVFFGSFAAGTYLPDADMDLVVLSREFRERRVPTIGQTKKELHKFAGLLQRSGIAKPNSTLTIWKAKVPIVKYVDSCTGLRCDISFENDTGPKANKTYADWKAQFPAMPIIVSAIKQFLLMRGMNEVHTGGLGSFSVNCLVVSLMQHMPQLSTGNMDPMKNLGEIFMHFLDFYGNKFNQTAIGIQMDPPRYFAKHLERRIIYDPKKMWKLSVLDPNRSENDISSGTTNIVAILKSFSSAFKTLQDRMNELRNRRIDNPGSVSTREMSDTSILGALYAGDYSSFERQRERMQTLYAESYVMQDQRACCDLGPGFVSFEDKPTSHALDDVVSISDMVHRCERSMEDRTGSGSRAEGSLPRDDLRSEDSTIQRKYPM